MKPIYFSLMLGVSLLLSKPMLAQVSNNQNYIGTEVAREAVSSHAAFQAQNNVNGKAQQIVYFDGLGRQLQQISVKGSASQSDLITFIDYDNLGRIPKTYLPFTSGGDGAYHLSPVAEQNLYYNQNFTHIDQSDRNNPFAETQFEASPRARVLQQGAAGYDWQLNRHAVIQEQRLNDVGMRIDRVRKWIYNPTTQTFTANGYYASNLLHVNETTDENGNRSLIFSDKMGRQLCIRRAVDATSTNFNFQKWASLNYLYDHQERLRHVIQPEGMKILQSNGWQFSPEIQENFTFSYNYDRRGRVIEKKVPGAGWEHYLYDFLDRQVGRQDANMREKGDWLITKYDANDRPIITALLHVGVGPAATRPMMQELITRSSDGEPTALWAMFEEKDPNGPHGYTDNAFHSLNNADVLSVTYYDSYDFNSDATISPEEDFLAENTLVAATDEISKRSRGAVTGIKTRILDQTNEEYLFTRTFYDEKGRKIQTVADNQMEGEDISTHRYNFAGELLESVQRHTSNINTVQTYQQFEYDHRGRLLKSWQDNHMGAGSWSPNPILIAAHSYDEWDQLVEKNLHSEDNGTNFLQSVDYLYNIRGWMSQINQIQTQCQNTGSGGGNQSNNLLGGGSSSGPPVFGNDGQEDLFGMELRYNKQTTDLPKTVNAQYNGNMAGWVWQTSSSCDPKAYAYEYDKLSRLKDAHYAEQNSNGYWINNDDRYSVRNLVYDLNGNMQSFQRFGATGVNQGLLTYGSMDNLSYQFKGNQLLDVSDAANVPAIPQVEQFVEVSHIAFDPNDESTHDYRYDENGNLIYDAHKGIEITYNFLNKPTLINFVQGTHAGKSMRFTYDAAGTKLRLELFDANDIQTKLTEYSAGFEYEDADGAATTEALRLQYFLHAEGRVRLDNNNFVYEYFLKDHLGNNRIVFGDLDQDGTAELLQEDHFYPFGMRHAGPFDLSTPENQFLYNGKERHEEMGLDWYDYGARMYNASIGRWNGVDALGEARVYLTPYNYVQNNPILRIDPDGNLDGIFVDEQGKIIGNDGIEDNKVYVIKTTRQKFDSGVSSAGIFYNTARETKEFIKTNSGNTSAFQNNNIAYSNSTEIEGIESSRKDMKDIVEQDSGTGGTSPPNNREYGGTIDNSGLVTSSPPGEVTDPSVSTQASITHKIPPDTKSTFHSHQSGQKVIVSPRPRGSITLDGPERTTYSFVQAPSQHDIDRTPAGQTNYVFARGERKVYIYNNKGVVATLPHRRFVKFKK
ncbi:MAG: DUF6443 domain-containing protein [Bacteroidota bacterium]